jgi:hypothetical protein
MKKNTLALDMIFLIGGALTILLLCMPKEYVGYRAAGCVGAGIFAFYLVWREMKRKRAKKEAGE